MNGASDTGSFPTFNIHVEGGIDFFVRSDEDSLLRAALRAGIDFPYECSVGGCGSCRFTLLNGDMADIWPKAPGLSARERGRGKRLACQSRPLSDCTISVRVGSTTPRAATRMEATLTGRRHITADTYEFMFSHHQPAAFQPGQYALVYLPDVEGPRAYSMSNLPNDVGQWKFIVRRTSSGAGSQALFDNVAVGSSLSIDGPYGHGHLRENDSRDIVCIAGGSGIGPMLSIAAGAHQVRPDRTIHFLLGLRSQRDLALADELTQLACEQTRLSIILSEPDPAGDWQGAKGFVHEHFGQLLPGDPHHYTYYMAGPPPMINALTSLMMTEKNILPDQVFFDRFV